jgi:hypothetical protein
LIFMNTAEGNPQTVRHHGRAEKEDKDDK